jgi:hypothetical protein
MASSDVAYQEEDVLKRTLSALILSILIKSLALEPLRDFRVSA